MRVWTVELCPPGTEQFADREEFDYRITDHDSALEWLYRVDTIHVHSHCIRLYQPSFPVSRFAPYTILGRPGVGDQPLPTLSWYFDLLGYIGFEELR